MYESIDKSIDLNKSTHFSGFAYNPKCLYATILELGYIATEKVGLPDVKDNHVHIISVINLINT